MKLVLTFLPVLIVSVVLVALEALQDVFRFGKEVAFALLGYLLDLGDA